MLKLNKQDHDFFFPLLDKENQKILSANSVINDNEVIIDDMDIEVDIYDWLNDLVIKHGLTKDQEEVNPTGKRLESISDYVFSVIESK